MIAPIMLLRVIPKGDLPSAIVRKSINTMLLPNDKTNTSKGENSLRIRVAKIRKKPGIKSTRISVR